MVKKRNRIRLLKLKEEKDKENLNMMNSLDIVGEIKKKEFSKTQHYLRFFPKMEK